MSKYYVNGSSVQEASKKLVQVNKTIDFQIDSLQSIVNNFGHDEYAMLQIRADIKRMINGIKDSGRDINLMKIILDDIVAEYQKSESQNYSAINQVCIVDLKISNDKGAIDMSNEILEKINTPETLLKFISDYVSDLYTKGLEMTDDILKATVEYLSEYVNMLKKGGFVTDFFLNLSDYANKIGEGVISVTGAIVRSGVETLVDVGVGSLIKGGIVIVTGASAGPAIIATVAIGMVIDAGFKTFTSKDFGRFVTDEIFNQKVGKGIPADYNWANIGVRESSRSINKVVEAKYNEIVQCHNTVEDDLEFSF